MIDLQKAKKAFEDYVSYYDKTIPSINLKIIHTYEVIKCSDFLCDSLGLCEEDKQLAGLIALLHDIGRFEQWVRYKSFADHKTTDHAKLSSDILFKDGLIEKFIDDRQYDEIIRISIEQHNKYKVDLSLDERILLFVHLIRDADKLDNFRVKEEETIETLLFASLNEVQQESISKEIYNQFIQNELIYAPNRKTHLDIWLSYIAFIFDLHFDASYHYIYKHNYVTRSFSRINPIEKETLMQYNQLHQSANDFIAKKVGLYEK